MDEKKFNELDKKMTDATKYERDKKVPWEILNGFAASVEEKILERGQKRAFGWFPQRAWIPAAVPVFAVLVLASWVTLKLPSGQSGPALTDEPAVQLAQAVHPESSDADLELLREMGEWSAEDDALLATATDADIQESVFS